MSNQQFCLVFGRGDPKRWFQGVRLEARERDSEKGKPLFRRKREEASHLDGSGHKGLADYQTRSFRTLRRAIFYFA